MAVKVDGQQFHSKFLSAITPMLKTKLKDKKREDQIKGTEDNKVFQILSSIGQLLEPDKASGNTYLKMGDLITIDEDDVDVEDANIEQQKNTLEQRDNLTPAEHERLRTNDVENEAAILNDDAARTTVDLLDSEEEEDDNDGNQPGSNTESKSNEKRPGKNKKKDSRAHNNEVFKTLGYNRWMHDSIWKNGAKHPIENDVKKKGEDVQKRLERKRDLKHSTQTLLLAPNQEQDLKKELEVDVQCWNLFIKDRFPGFYS